MLKLILIFAVVLTVSSCARRNKFDVVHAQAEAIQMSCIAKRERGEIQGYAATVRCGTPEIRALYARARWPYMDLIDLERAQLEAIAEKHDNKVITDTEARAMRAEMQSKIVGEMDRRHTSAVTRRAAVQSSMPVMCQTNGFTTVCY